MLCASGGIGAGPRAGFRLNLAEGLQKAQRYEQALIELQGVIARDPANARAWEKSGDIAALRNDEDRATAGWERARSLDTSNVSPALKLARLAIARQNLAQALNILDSAASRTPADPGLLELRCEALVMRRDWSELKSTSAYWTRAYPDNPASWRAAARAAFERGLHAQAMDAFRHVMQLEQPSAANLTVVCEFVPARPQHRRRAPVARGSGSAGPRQRGDAVGQSAATHVSRPIRGGRDLLPSLPRPISRKYLRLRDTGPLAARPVIGGARANAASNRRAPGSAL